MPIKFFYFPNRGRGEITRYILHQAGVAFDDVMVSGEDWGKNKPKNSPFGQLPYAEVDGQFIGQSISIARFFANKYGLGGKNEVEKARADQFVDALTDLFPPLISAVKLLKDGDAEKAKEPLRKFEIEHFQKFLEIHERVLANSTSRYLVGDALTWADLALAEFLDRYTIQLNSSILAEFPELRKHHQMIYELPKIKAFANQRPRVPV